MMATKELRVMVGAPGSGKSTFIKREANSLEYDGWTVAAISRDAIRFKILKPGESYFCRESEVFEEFVRQINEAMEIGIDVVFADATHIDNTSRKKLLNRLIPDPNTVLVFDIMETPKEQCLRQNAQRTGVARVPDNVIENMCFKLDTSDWSPFKRKYTWGFERIKFNHHYPEFPAGKRLNVITRSE